MSLEFDELKGYIKETLGKDITDLISKVGQMNERLRAIELMTTTRMAEVQKDITQLYEEITEIKTGQERMGESQKFRWHTLDEEKKQEDKEQAIKDIEQSKINDRFQAMERMIWLILVILIPMALSFLWAIITHKITLTGTL